MPIELKAHLVPSMAREEHLAGSTAVVIDLLRASTTICAALWNGAKSVAVQLEPQAARIFAGARPAGTCVLGGERRGVRIEGFDLGNSPSEYTRGRVGAKTVVFTTTNGTRALYHCCKAERILVGCLANLSALADELCRSNADVHLVCAGTNGEVSMDDCIAAGAIASAMQLRTEVIPNDEARLCIAAWRRVTSSPDDLLQALRETKGGRQLVSIRLSMDVAQCARMDWAPILPEFKPGSMLVVRADATPEPEQETSDDAEATPPQEA